MACRNLQRAIAMAMVLSVSILFVVGLAHAANRLHPNIELLDIDGNNVLESGAPVSPMQTCDGCHDTEFIAGHSDHIQALDRAQHARLAPGQPSYDADPAAYVKWLKAYGSMHVGGGDAAKAGLDLNCFLCHTGNPAVDQRKSEIAAGNFRWAATATLANLGVARRSSNGWLWNPESFNEDQEVTAEFLGIGAPSSDACGACHGKVYYGKAPLEIFPASSNWNTYLRGEVYSPQRMADSGMNIQGKDRLGRPFDVHAERMVSCSNCHHAQNDPASFRSAQQRRLGRLKTDVRRPSISDFLETPDHHLARGWTSFASANDPFAGSMRRCEDCHDVNTTHTWLPYPKRHMDVLDCESCHIPRVDMPALQEADWTVLTLDRQPRRVFRGIDGPVDSPATIITPWQPVLLKRSEGSKGERVAPFNLVTSWRWVSGAKGEDVSLEDLQRAYFEGEAYAPAIIAALDADQNGMLDEKELVLDTPTKVDVVHSRLEGLGLKEARIVGEMEPYGLHHGVASGDFAQKDCQACHGRQSQFREAMQVASVLPGDVIPTLADGSSSRMDGRFFKDEAGRYWYTGEIQQSSLYMLGASYNPQIDFIGTWLIILTLLVVIFHALIRFIGRQRSNREVRS